MLKIPGIIPIRVHPFFWLLAFLIGWMNSFNIILTGIWMLVILVSVLAHEFGHALTALAFGQRPYIELVALGGVTKRPGGKLKLWKEFLIVLNGPLMGFFLFAVAYYVYVYSQKQPMSLFIYSLDIAMYVNLFWTLVNLLPVQPLDGGVLLNIVLEGMFGLKGLKISLFISLLIAALISILFFAFQQPLAGALFLLFGFENYRSWKVTLSVTEKDRDSELQHLLKAAEKQMLSGHDEEAVNLLQRIRDQAKAGILYVTATEHLANIFSNQGRYKEAYEILEPIRTNLNPDALHLLHQLAYRSEEWATAAALGDHVYQLYPSYDTALTNALSYALLGNARPAVGWLQCALREGLQAKEETLRRHEFDKIRHDPLFQDLLKRVQT